MFVDAFRRDLMMTASDSRNKTPPFSGIPTWVPLLAFMLLTFLICMAGYAIFDQYKKSIIEQEVQNLGAIADLKVAQIVAWREGHKRWAEHFLHGDMLPDEIDQWLREGAPANQRKQKILKVLSSMLHEQGYKTISLLDKEGAVRISTDDSYATDTEEKQLAVDAVRSRHVLFSDLHWEGRGDNDLCIDSVAPLIVTDKKNTTRIVGVLLFEIDPDLFLYPLIQSWPTQSASAETLLVRRDGNDILFLNEVRHVKGAALSLRIPLTKTQLPSTQAVLHHVKSTVGIDYRGVPVVAAIRSIPDTPWFMVAKIDKAELFAPINTLQRWATGLVLAFAAFGGALVFLWFKGQQVRYANLKTQHDAAVEREMLLKHFEYLSRYANDMIIVTNEAGQVIEANERAQQALGYSREELLHKHVLELYSLLDSPSIPDKLLRLKQEGELRVEGIFQRKDGSTFPVEISARVIEVQGTHYSQGIIRDITERKLAEERLAESYQKLEKLTIHLESVREDEQTRIARELHDEMGGVLAALNINVFLLAAQIPAEMTDIQAKVADLERLITIGIYAMQRTVAELRPTLLDEVGLKFAIEKYVQEFERNTEIECELRLPEEELMLDTNQSSAIFRIMQESLTNVAKHAKASRVSIALSEWDSSLVLTVKDNGIGFDLNVPKATNSFGLLGIRERAAMLGGTAEITSAAGKGTMVLVSLPRIESQHEGGPAITAAKAV